MFASTWSGKLSVPIFHCDRPRKAGASANNYPSCVPLLVPPDDRAFLETAAEVYAKHDRYPEALALAVRLYDEDLVRKYYSAPTNRYVLSF